MPNMDAVSFPRPTLGDARNPSEEAMRQEMSNRRRFRLAASQRAATPRALRGHQVPASLHLPMTRSKDVVNKTSKLSQGVALG